MITESPFLMNLDTLPRQSFIIENDKVMCCLLRDDIFFAYHKPESMSDISDMDFLFDHYRELVITRGPLKVLVAMDRNSSMEKEAREHLQAQREPAICEAVVFCSLAQRILVNFYFKFNNPSYPSQAFNSIDKAIAWTDTHGVKELEVVEELVD